MNATRNDAAIAAEIAQTDRLRLHTLLHAGAGDNARQGDLMLAWFGEAPPVTDARYNATEAGGIVLASGSHGEHRLVSDAMFVDGGKVVLGSVGLLVHTDKPDGRHATIVCRPGAWEIINQQEVGLDESIVQVKD